MNIRLLLLSCLVLAGMSLATSAQAQSSSYWYYCDASHAYYPYVQTCAQPWRWEVPKPGNAAQIPLSAPPGTLAAPTQTGSSAFRDGQEDWRNLEAWFSGLTADNRAGVEYWAGRRSLQNPGSCNVIMRSMGAGAVGGCLAAQQKFAPLDARRKTEPDYRLGWNSPTTPAESPYPTSTHVDALNIPYSSPTATTETVPAVDVPRQVYAPIYTVKETRNHDGSVSFGVIIVLGLIVLSILIYFIPAILAANRKLACGAGIVFLVNLLVGWTLIGWLVCLLWAALGQSEQQVAFYARARGP
jgi:hypothetical protein